MSVKEIQASLEELQSLDQEKIAKSCKSIVCNELEEAFKKVEGSNAAMLIAYACSMHLNPENASKPFSPKFIMNGSRAIIASDFSKEFLNVLADFCSEVTIPELKARLADICLVTKAGSIEHAYMAIDAYLESAQNLLGEDDDTILYFVAQRIERALRIIRMYKCDSQRPDLFNKICDFVISEINNKNLNDTFLYTLHLLNLSCKFGICDNEQILNNAQDIAKSRFELGDIMTSIQAWECALSATEDKNKQQEIWRQIATCHVKESEMQDGAIISVGCLLKAIDALAKVPKTRQERLELYEKMRDYQLESLHQLNKFSINLPDMSTFVHNAKTQVQGKDLFDMLFRLGVVVSKPTDISTLKNKSIEQMQNSFAWQFGGIYMDHEGITVAKVPASIGGLDDKANDEIIWSIMMQNIQIEHRLAVQAQIRPAIDEIMTQHHVSEHFIESVFQGHPFIPYGHEYFFIKGIILGLEGDFLSACHILIPQIENSLRYLVRSQGEEPTTLHGNGSQERSSFKVLLEHPAITEILGQNIVGNIHAILIDKIYGNLRNEMSHGYMPAGHFYSSSSVFLWWLVLHILMRPLYSQWKQEYDSGVVDNKEIELDS